MSYLGPVTQNKEQIINYVTNGRATSTAAGWSLYNDGANAQPVDGSGGVATVTWTRSTTTPLRSGADFNFTTPGGSVQGQGVATDITIDLADQAKVLTVSFDYEVLSGTYATGDLTVYLIADPSGTPVVIQPAGYQIQSGTAGTKLRQIATFQTQATGQSYRVCFHVASTSASAYSLAIDNVVVGPQTVQYGAPVTDWQTFTPTGGWTTNTTYTGRWRRVGDSMEVSGRVSLSGAPNAASLTVNLPSGFSIDTTKLASTASSKQLGLLTWFDAAVPSNQTGLVIYSSTTAVLLEGQRLSSASNHDIAPINATTPKTFASGDQIDFTFSVPILGWSSTVQMSNDTDTRVVAAKYTSSSTAAVPNAPTVFDFSSKSIDTHGAVTTGAAWKFTAPVAGIYRYTAKFLFTSAAAASRYDVYPLKNGVASEAFYITTSGSFIQQSLAEGLIDLNAGDTLAFQHNETVDGGSYLSGSTVSIERLSGPSAIAATESVVARYRTTTFSGTSGIVILTAKQIDTHGAYNTSTGVWTCPVSGIYLINGFLQSGATAYGVGGYLEAYASIDGAGAVSGFILGGSRAESVSAINRYATGSMTIRLNAGQTVSLYQSSSTSTAPVYAALDIVRVGN